jgi:DNA polymerase
VELDVAQLREAALAYLAWEEELSGFGLPQLSDLASQTVEVAATVPVTSSVQVTPAVEPVRQTANDAVSTPAVDRRVRLAQLEEEVRSCTRCELARGRTQTVFARGNPDSPLVFVGEGPGQEEDRRGSPFVGPAGQLLDKMVAAMGYQRDDVYICNVVKCRPPGNRTPLPSEAGACAPFLLGQIDAIAPRVLVALGRCAAENMGLVSGGGWRGRWGEFRGIPVMPTYHPAFLLRSPEFKRPVWEDLQKVMARLKQPGA